jgi:hypothetical protein
MQNFISLYSMDIRSFGAMQDLIFDSVPTAGYGLKVMYVVMAGLYERSGKRDV